MSRWSAAATRRRKQLARGFYENIWFKDNTEVFADYVADGYVIHDIGDTKVTMPTEPAVTQKLIANLHHAFGDMTGEIDYQIAKGDKVATRWFIYLDPPTGPKRWVSRRSAEFRSQTYTASTTRGRSWRSGTIGMM